MYAHLVLYQKQFAYLKRIGYRHYNNAADLSSEIISLDVSINHKMFRYGEIPRVLHSELSNRGVEKNKYKNIGCIKFDKLINRKSLWTF